MKKITVILALMSTVLFLAPSCKKCDRDQQNQALTQTVTASINENTSYTFEVPASNNHNPFQIATQATNFKVSQIATTATGSVVYQYTPTLNYVGSDQVILSNESGPVMGTPPPPPNGSNNMNGGCGHNPPPQCNHGNCPGHDDSMSITINITVKSTAAATTTNTNTY
jgi:hypothetical protein